MSDRRLLHLAMFARSRWSLSLGLHSNGCNGDFPHGDLCGRFAGS